MSYHQQLDRVRTDPDTAVTVVRDNDTIVVPIAAGEPPTLLHALSERREHLRGVVVSQLLGLGRYAYLSEAHAGNVRHSSPFLGAATRTGAHEGWIDWVPAHFSEVPVLIRQGLMPCDVVFAQVSPMSPDGLFALGVSTDYTLAAIEKARAVVLEVNPQLPFTNGNCHVHVSQVTHVVDATSPMVELAPSVIGPTQVAIAQHVAELIPDGSTLQIGIGGIPDAVVKQLMTKNDLGLHTEMLGDGTLSLVEAGVITGARKNVHPGKLIATFALGSERLYEFMHHNPDLEMHPVDYTNAPALASRNDNLHSINGTLAVDFFGQCASESLGRRPFSGPGGQVDFVRAANASNGGKSIMVVPSTAKDDSISRIVATHEPGTPITTGKNDVDHVVTEFGVARLRGRSVRERTHALIEIAHPNFRDQLTEQAKDLRLW